MALEHRDMKFRPLHDRVALRRVDSESKTSGGIIIPDTAAEKPQQGEVVAVGPGARNQDGKIVPVDVRKGERHHGRNRELARRSASIAASSIQIIRTEFV
jgi:co-chaperonin GroES (HSP10)